MNILVTGGLGYIGSHTCVELLGAGHEVVVVDNLCNAKRAVQERITRIAGKAFTFIEADVRDRAAMEAAFRAADAHGIRASLFYLGEYVADPAAIEHNVSQAINA